jgi:hypothetical protein
MMSSKHFGGHLDRVSPWLTAQIALADWILLLWLPVHDLEFQSLLEEGCLDFQRPSRLPKQSDFRFWHKADIPKSAREVSF